MKMRVCAGTLMAAAAGWVTTSSQYEILSISVPRASPTPPHSTPSDTILLHNTLFFLVFNM